MIPLSVPNLSGKEWEYIKDCLDTNWVSSVGSYVNRFEEMAATFSNVRRAVATSNGTAALHISMMLAGVVAEDLVIVPNITFVASVNAIKYIGAFPVLIDVDADTWQMDTDLLKRFLEEECILKAGNCYHNTTGRRVGAIMPVHVLGNMVDMDALMGLSIKYNIPVIEDATEALGSTYNGNPAGSFGVMGCLSYNGNKIITTGGGGMILTNDEALGARAKHITTQAKADPVEYYHDEIGYNYRLVNILAAMGVAQMEQLPGFLIRKKQIAEMYDRGLGSIPGFKPQTITKNVVPNNWLYTAWFNKSKQLMEHLGRQSIQARPFWVPMNRLPAFAKDVYYHQADVAGSVYGNCLSLPCSTNITDEEVTRVIECIQIFYAS